MQKFEVTRTETVTVIARNEEHAEEVAIEEMQENPNGDYEIKRLAPAVLASLHEVRVYLEGMGFHALYIKTPHHIDLQHLDIGTHQVEDMFGKMVPCSRFTLYGQTNDGATWNGEGWFLQTCEGEEVAEFENLNSLELAGRIAYQIGRADFDLESRGRN
jgi:hypothetical protein